jgi:hypothetical protein
LKTTVIVKTRSLPPLAFDLDPLGVLLNTGAHVAQPRRSPAFAMLDELEASRASRKRAWENLQEIRYVLSDEAGMELPPPARNRHQYEGGLEAFEKWPTVNPNKNQPT